MEINSLSDVELAKIFSHSVVLLTVSFALQKLLSFRRSHLIYCCSQYTGIIRRKWSFVPMHWRLLPTFSSIRFSVVEFILRSFIYLDLSFVHDDRYGSIYILLYVDIQLFQHHLLKMLSFFHYIILASLSKIRCS